jgi:choline dehydrogenase-like flavoprotein
VDHRVLLSDAGCTSVGRGAVRDGLRVMDASIMPRIISANTNATVMAVADKGVDLLTGTYTGRVAAAP